MTLTRTTSAVVYLAFALPFGLVSLGRTDLTRMEPIIALGARHMLDSGGWFVPHLYGEVYAFKRFAPFADALRLVVVPNLTHYGHVESYNERLANLMVTAFRDYFPH